MTIGKGKRPRDPNQLAKWIVDQSTSESPTQERERETAPKPSPGAPVAPTTAPANLSEYMAAIGRKGGQIGGKRRLKTMTREQRRKVAVKAARTRWKNKPAK